MNNIFSYYTKYTNYTDEYACWEKNNYQTTEKNTAVDSSFSQNNNKLKQKAKIVAQNLLLHDRYEHEKAEDSETFFLTLNMELMSLAGAIASLPAAITKTIPFLEKNSDKNDFFKKSANLLEKYKNSTISVMGKSFSLPKCTTAIFVGFVALLYATGIKKSMESQLGIIRKASYDATQNQIHDYKTFAILNEEQENQVKTNTENQKNKDNVIVDKLKDKIDINSSFKEVGLYKKNYKNYMKNKSEYMENIKRTTNADIKDEESRQAIEDKILFENYLKNVEHDVLEPLRKIETIANISYSFLFTGGFLEYLVTDKLVQLLGVKNKALSMVIKIAAPLLTYLLLNKNISDIENKAILATKYKHLKEFTENPQKYNTKKDEKKESIPKFLKTVYKDMKEYEKFSREELPELKNKMEAKKQVTLTPQQEKDAKRLQKNTSMVINTQREELYNQSVGIKALSETILGPIDVLSTALGGFIGHNIAKKFPNNKFSSLFTGIGAVIAFIPAAIAEAQLTKQQKLSEKIAVMNALKNLQNPKKFADNSPSSRTTYSQLLQENNISSVFKNF